jgi:DNA-binding NtrC family response regulator
LEPAPAEGTTWEEVEKKYIETVLRDRNWSVVKAAEVLGVPRSSLYQKIKLYQINLPRNISNTE